MVMAQPARSGYNSAVLTAPVSLVVLALVLAMVGVAGAWYRRGQQHLDTLRGAAAVIGVLAQDLPPDHPVRVRLERAPVAELSLEELVALVSEHGPAAHGLLRLRLRSAWIERFAQFAVHLGILGTVLALMLVDATEIDSFRARLPMALSTTFFGLVGALLLGTIGGAVDTVLEQARVHLRRALVERGE